MKINFKILVLAFILLNITLVSAEQYELSIDQTANYKGIPITLNRIGSFGSAELTIDGEEKVLPRASILEFKGIKIRHNYTISEILYIEVETIVECLQDSDCNDNKKATQDSCVNDVCEYKSINCCLIGNECKEPGAVEVIDEKSKYCSSNFDWIERKPYKTPCSYNYECLTNNCDGYCKAASKIGETYKGKMAPAWLLTIIGCLMILVALLFLVNPKIGKRITNNLVIKTEDKPLRIFFLVVTIIGIALIFWALL